MSEPYRLPPHKEGDDDLVTVASRPTALDAEMARVYLADHGITAFVQDAASFNPIINEIGGGTRLVVRDADAHLARSLLRALERPSTSDDQDDGESGEIRCPRCELAYCFYETSSQTSAGWTALHGLAALLSFVFGVFQKKRWRCHKCLHVWDDPAEGPARATPLDPDDPRPIFALERGRGGVGFLIGLMIMALSGVVLVDPSIPRSVGPLLLFFPLIGFAVGRRFVSLSCSAPGCRAPLEPGAKECRACGGSVAGVIHRVHEHYAEAAAFRRELAALKATDTRRARSKKAP